MKKNFTYLGILIVALIIQSSFFPPLFSSRSLPQIILIIVISWTVIAGFRSAFWWAVLAGFFSDIVFGQKIGTEILILAVVSYLVSFFSRRFLIENKFWGGMVLAGFVTGATILHWFWSEFVFLEGAGYKFEEILKMIFWNTPPGWYKEILYDVILFVPCYWIFNKIESSRLISSGQTTV